MNVYVVYISLYVNVSVLGALTCFSRRAARRVCRISPAGAALSPPEHSPRGSCCFHSPDESLADPTDPWHPAATQLIIHTYIHDYFHTYMRSSPAAAAPAQSPYPAADSGESGFGRRSGAAWSPSPATAAAARAICPHTYIHK